jgi:hypothetical protein
MNTDFSRSLLQPFFVIPEYLYRESRFSMSSLSQAYLIIDTYEKRTKTLYTVGVMEKRKSAAVPGGNFAHAYKNITFFAPQRTPRKLTIPYHDMSL